MENSEKLMELRAITEADDDDAVLLSFLRQAEDVILNRLCPYLDERTFSELVLPERYQYKQVRIAAYLLNKRGAEGEVQHVENGINRKYNASAVPSDLLADIIPSVSIPR